MIKLYSCKFKMDRHDAFHIVIRPFDENILDKKSLMSEELHILKSYIKYIKEVKTVPALLIDTPTFGNYMKHKHHKEDR